MRDECSWRGSNKEEKADWGVGRRTGSGERRGREGCCYGIDEQRRRGTRDTGNCEIVTLRLCEGERESALKDGERKGYQSL